jgi:hypothetical protein
MRGDEKDILHFSNLPKTQVPVFRLFYTCTIASVYHDKKRSDLQTLQGKSP